jgi:hypothetical protein
LITGEYWWVVNLMAGLAVAVIRLHGVGRFMDIESRLTTVLLCGIDD